MAGRSGDRRYRLLALAGLVLYAIFLVAAPFEHHDLACHLKTPQHCTSCTSSQLGSDPGAPLVPPASQLVDAGSAVSVHLLGEGTLLAARSTGRSPPLSA
jgi:hypothetical protein